jgi:hypothetical protein
MDNDGGWKQAELRQGKVCRLQQLGNNAFNGGKCIDFNVPIDLKGGYYVIRAEVINLAISEPEFFPGCTVWHIQGIGLADIDTGKQGKFPGMYGADDVGLTSGAPIYDMRPSQYQFPGLAPFIK